MGINSKICVTQANRHRSIGYVKFHRRRINRLTIIFPYTVQSRPTPTTSVLLIPFSADENNQSKFKARLLNQALQDVKREIPVIQSLKRLRHKSGSTSILGHTVLGLWAYTYHDTLDLILVFFSPGHLWSTFLTLSTLNRFNVASHVLNRQRGVTPAIVSTLHQSHQRRSEK